MGYVRSGQMLPFRGIVPARVRSSPERHVNRLSRGGYAGLIIVLLVACEPSTSDRVTIGRQSARTADADTGTVHGTVVMQPAVDRGASCVPATPCTPLAGATVQLGLWQQPATMSPDTVGPRPLWAELDDPRFEILAETTTDAIGRYRFPGIPKKAKLAIRAIPPPAVLLEVGYFPSRFWLYESAEMELKIVLRRP